MLTTIMGFISTYVDPLSSSVLSNIPQVPDNLTDLEKLSFNISMLFPQNVVNVSSFAVMLPLFQQSYAALSPQIQFDQAVLGGPMSNVSVDVSGNRSTAKVLATDPRFFSL